MASVANLLAMLDGVQTQANVIMRSARAVESALDLVKLETDHLLAETSSGPKVIVYVETASLMNLIVTKDQLEIIELIKEAIRAAGH